MPFALDVVQAAGHVEQRVHHLALQDRDDAANQRVELRRAGILRQQQALTAGKVDRRELRCRAGEQSGDVGEDPRSRAERDVEREVGVDGGEEELADGRSLGSGRLPIVPLGVGQRTWF